MTSPPVPVPAPASPYVVVGASLGDLDLAGLGPLTLRVGQRLLAEVLAVQAETGRTLLSLAGRRLEAQIPPGIRQGEIVRVVVAQVLPDRVVFRIDTSPAEVSLSSPHGAGGATSAGSARPQLLPSAALASPASAPQPTHFSRTALPLLEASRLLAELELPDTPTARAIVHALVERRQPLSRESIQQLRALVSAVPTTSAAPGSAPAAIDVELDARAAVRLHEAGLPLTPRAMQLMRTSLSPTTAVPLGALLSELVTTLRATLGTPARTRPQTPAVPSAGGAPTRSEGDPAARALQLAATSPAPAELARVISLYASTPEAELLAAADSDGPFAPASSGREPAPALTEPATRQNARTLLLGLLEGSSDVADALQSTSPASPRSPTTVAGAEPEFMGASAAPTDPSAAAQSRASQLVGALHDRIELEQVRAASAGRTSALTLADASTSLQVAPAPASAVAGMQLPPELLPAVPAAPLPTNPIALSIPLAIAGQFATLQLVVQREPDRGSQPATDDTPAVRASFTLHLRRLGEVGADLRLQGPQVRCRLRAASSEVAGRLSEGLNGLQARLEHAGLDVRQLECIVAGAATDGPSTPAIELRHVAAEA